VCMHHVSAAGFCSSVFAGLDMMHACVLGPVVSHLSVVGLLRLSSSLLLLR
jgi:hypothetical protein